MILSHDQIKKITVCPDCVRREVVITVCATSAQIHDHVMNEVGMCLCSQLDHPLLEPPVNIVSVLHDDGCPKLCQIVPGSVDELQIHPVDLPDHHPWVLKLADKEPQSKPPENPPKPGLRSA
jgi:hypothetical protein